MILITSELDSISAGTPRQINFVDDFFLNSKEDSYTYINCKLSIINFNKLTWTKYKLNLLKNGATRAGVNSSKFQEIGRLIKHSFLLDINWILLLKIPLFLFINRKLFNSKKKITVIASSPNPSTMLIAVAIKFFFKNARITLDFRDAWAHHPNIKRSRSIRKIIEKYLISKSDKVQTVSRYLKDEFDYQYNISSSLIYNKPLKIDYLEDEKKYVLNILRKFKNKRVLLYSGNFHSAHYDNELIIDAINFLDKNNFIVLIAGSCEWLKSNLNERKISKNVIFFGSSLRYSIVRLMQFNVSGLLFFAHQGFANNGVVSTKIFEYIDTGNPIYSLSICDESDLKKILEEKNNININSDKDFKKFFECKPITIDNLHHIKSK